MAPHLLAGCARADITPEPGSLMACFPRGSNREPRRAEGAHDPLQAKAVVFSDGHSTVAICSCDLAIIREIDVRRIRELVGRSIPELGGTNLIVAASHTHSSPETAYLFGNTPDDPWVLEMDRDIAEAVIRAHGSRQPVTAKLGKAEAHLSHNRRVIGADGRANMVREYRDGETTGPYDPELILLRLDSTSGPAIAILYNYTAHALTVGPGNLLYTADYPGLVSEALETEFPGTTALFLNGAAGNTHPRKCMRPDFVALEEIGEQLGKQTLAAAQACQTVDDCSLRLASDTMTFVNRVDSSKTVTIELSCLAIGPVLLAFVPGEVFVELQLAFKRQLAPRTALLVGYANGWDGYIPTRDAYESGGYGVDLCTTDPAEYSRTALPPGAGEAILERLLMLGHAAVR